MSDDDIIMLMKKKSEAPPKLKKPKKIHIPRRQPSEVIPERKIEYITADKTTCAECTCYPKEAPYEIPKLKHFPKIIPQKKIHIPRRQPSEVIPERKIEYITADKTTCAECTCYPKEAPYEIPKLKHFPKIIPQKKIHIPRRQPSEVIPERKIEYITADKTTCAECTCYPKEAPYEIPKRLLPCQKNPRLLYELAAAAVDKLRYPAAFAWTERDVADWMERDVGLPQYRECMVENHIDGLRLLMLEDPSKLPPINIHYFDHIQRITSKVRILYTADFIYFLRSIGLPPRRPLVHTTWFKSRTGPSWGVRKNWTRCDILRWMKIIMPEPVHRDHWDLVWYQKPDFPSVKFARVPPLKREVSDIPRYTGEKGKMRDNLVHRKFIILKDIPPEMQYIWVDRTPYSPIVLSTSDKKEKEPYFLIRDDSALLPKKIVTEGLKGRDLILARRKMPKPKFLDMKYAKA